MYQSSGTELRNVEIRQPQSKRDELHHNVPYEFHLGIETERPMSHDEAKATVETYMDMFERKHPEHECRYVEVRDLSEKEATSLGLGQPAYEATVQVMAGSPQFLAALLIVVTSIGVSAFTALGFAEIAITLAAVYLAIRTVDYIVGPTTFRCPKCGKTFEGIEDYEAHLREAHEENEPELVDKLIDTAEESEETDWKDIAMWGAVGIGGAMVLSSVLGD